MILSRRALLVAASALALSTPALAADPIPVVASFSILGDMVKQVGGDRIAVKTLVGPNGDAHVYNPTPADAKAVAAAKVVFINGLGFEGWMERLAKASGTKAPQIVATKGIVSHQMEDDGKTVTDPHAWQAVANAKVYVANIRDGLVAADPDGKATYEANADAYLKQIDALDAEVKDAIAKVPADKRKIITTHDAFGYFAEEYHVEFLSAQGVSTEAEATPKKVAKLISQIKETGIKSVFLENMTDPRLTTRIAKETGVKLGGELYADALSLPNGPAATYIDLVRNNVKLITASLTGA
jgi:zinc/manganese transport system substrate-binding protein